MRPLLHMICWLLLCVTYKQELACWSLACGGQQVFSSSNFGSLLYLMVCNAKENAPEGCLSLGYLDCKQGDGRMVFLYFSTTREKYTTQSHQKIQGTPSKAH